MFPSLIIATGLVHGLVLLCFFTSSHGQSAPNLTLISISEGCIVDGQSMVVIEGIADFTGRDSIGDWDNTVNMVTIDATVCSVTLSDCPSSPENCYCQKGVNEDYKIVMNRTANTALSNKDISLAASRFLPGTLNPINARSNGLSYPIPVSPKTEKAQLSDSSVLNLSNNSGILPDDITSINYTVTGLQEPYGLKYSYTQTQMYYENNTESVNIIVDQSQRILNIGFEEFGPTCNREASHSLCKKGGIEVTAKFNNESITTIPEEANNLTFYLSAIYEPYFVEVTITYDGSQDKLVREDNNSNIFILFNGSVTEICIRYEETDTSRPVGCRGQDEKCYPKERTESPCSCDCDDWEDHTVILVIAMVVHLICGILFLVFYCLKGSWEKWPVATLVPSLVMVVTVVVAVAVMCDQEISDCGLCDCHYAFILVVNLVTTGVIFFIMLILYKSTDKTNAYFKNNWFYRLYLVVAVVLAAISIIGIVVVFCNKEISGSGVESWHIIYLLIAIAMTVIIVAGLIFLCKAGKQVDHDKSKSNEKPPNGDHEMTKTDVVDGTPNPGFGDGADLKTNQSNGEKETDNQSPRRLPPLQLTVNDEKGFNSIPSSISSQEANHDTTEVRKMRKKKRKGESAKDQQIQDSVDSKESTEANSPRRHSNSKIYPEESLGQPPAGRPLPSPRQLPPLNV